LIVAALVAAVALLSRHDHADERLLSERTEYAAMQDSIVRMMAESDSLREAREQRRVELDSLRLVWAQQKEERERQKAEREKRYADERARREAELLPLPDDQLVLLPFDPNQADSTTLVHLGLTPKSAHGLLRYREAGGRFRVKEDMAKIHGVTDSLYARLEPFILLPSREEKQASHTLKKDTIIELNSADTTALLWLRGIGSYSARQIVAYREGLGGFYDVQQVREVPYLRGIDTILVHFTVDTTLIRPLYINRLSVTQLQRHKYISVDQAAAIYNYRHSRMRPIRSWDDMRRLKTGKREDAFDEAELRRLRPYIRFDE